MKQLQLPNTDLTVSNISYGTTGFDGKFPLADGLALVGQYLEAGGNFLDTAHCYSFWVPDGLGASERFVGAAAKEFGRSSLVIATKGGHCEAGPGYPRPDSFMSPELVQKDLNESLERLDLPQVDIYYLHRDDPRIPVDEVMSAMSDHVTAGRARYLGASNWSTDRYLAANRYATANGLPPFAILQNQWSLAQPDWKDMDAPGAMRYVLDSEIPEVSTQQIPVAAYTASAGGYFATDGRTGGPDTPLARARLTVATRLATEKAVSPNQITLAYLLNRPFPVIAIVGTRDSAHLKESLEASEIALSDEEIRALTDPS
jgi:aryl-alcohol dehydrogenase-like predicted oxidoreductase